MLVKDKNTQKTLTVHGVYWASYKGRAERFHLVVPEEGYPGLIALPSSEIEIIDSSLDGLVISKDVHGQDALIDHRLRDQSLLERLIDHDPDAMLEYEALFLES